MVFEPRGARPSLAPPTSSRSSALQRATPTADARASADYIGDALSRERARRRRPLVLRRGFLLSDSPDVGVDLGTGLGTLDGADAGERAGVRVNRRDPELVSALRADVLRELLERVPESVAEDSLRVERRRPRRIVRGAGV